MLLTGMPAFGRNAFPKTAKATTSCPGTEPVAEAQLKELGLRIS